MVDQRSAAAQREMEPDALQQSRADAGQPAAARGHVHRATGDHPPANEGWPVSLGRRNPYQRLRDGAALRFGRVAFLRGKLLDHLMLRLHDAERTLGRTGFVSAMPFDLPKPVAEGERRRRSIVFIHNCYYNFFYLAAALRRR